MLSVVNASTVYLILRVLVRFSERLMFTTYSVYYVKSLGLNPLQLVPVGTAVEATVFVFEVPTGVVADIWGRRASVITGMFLMSSAYIGQGAIPWLGGTGITAFSCFGLVVVAKIVRGVGWTFISGAHEAWITDEVGEDQVGRLPVPQGQPGRPCDKPGRDRRGIFPRVKEAQPALPHWWAGAPRTCRLPVVFMPEHKWRRVPAHRASAWGAVRAIRREGNPASR
ncbi:MAG: MFS transporter [Bacillota bacterium]|nr:MFS transporter [Bacillota bacterium]